VCSKILLKSSAKKNLCTFIFLAGAMAETIQKKRFEKIKKIGEGTYGSVSKVFDNKLKKIIAVKKIKFQDD
jgi:serine/threonine protein kinase